MLIINNYFFFYSNGNSSFESIKTVFVNIHNLLNIFMNSRQCSIMEHSLSETSNNILFDG